MNCLSFVTANRKSELSIYPTVDANSLQSHYRLFVRFCLDIFKINDPLAQLQSKMVPATQNPVLATRKWPVDVINAPHIVTNVSFPRKLQKYNLKIPFPMS